MNKVPQIPLQYLKTKIVNRRFDPQSRDSFVSCGFRSALGRSINARDKVDTFHASVNVLRGSGQYIDFNGRSHLLQPGCVLQKWAGKPYSILFPPDENCSLCWISMSEGTMRSLSQYGLIHLHRPLLHPGISLPTLRKLEIACHSISSAQVGDLPALFLQLLEILLDWQRLDARQKSRDFETRFVNESCKLLSSNPETSLSLQEIAGTFNMSYERFRKVFREKLGTSPGEYRISRRIERARELLEEGPYSIKEVSTMLGYSNPFIFSSQFKKHTGFSPSQFRTGGRQNRSLLP